MRRATTLQRARVAGFLGLALVASLEAGQLQAQTQARLLLPEGTVLTVRTQNELNSASVNAGDHFVTTVTEAVALNGYQVIPAGTQVEGVVTLAKPATRSESGVIGVDFTRMLLPGGSVVAIVGKLTSTDAAERQQIEAQGNQRVVFIGGRRGTGAAIGAIGAAADPTGVLGTLGSLLSKGADAVVPANTTLAVQLQNGISLVGTRTGTTTNGSAIFTSADVIRATQQALRTRNYYYGPVDGRMNNDFRRALFNFQIDNNVNATGNLDDDTIDRLGVNMDAVYMPPGTAVFNATQAGVLRRNALNLVGLWRDNIAVSAAGRLGNRSYTAAELELYFALSAFADNTTLYERLLRQSANMQGMSAANTALLISARRVDTAMQNTSVPSRIRTGWSTVQTDLRIIDPSYF
jgi:hypothetical protein